MHLTAEEKLMYQVMKAMYDSGIPVDFKGSMVLKACLLEAGCLEEIRHTVDIDGNWYADAPPTGEQMTQSLQCALRKGGIDLDASIYRMYGPGRSAGFELRQPQTGEMLFSMDIDVNRPAVPARLYEVAGFRFRGVAPGQMLADKVSAISTDKVFRRVKDIVDLYYLAKVFDFEKAEVLKILEADGRTLGSFEGFLHRTAELQHSYEKFRFEGGVNKPPFDAVYRTVKTYIKEVLPAQGSGE